MADPRTTTGLTADMWERVMAPVPSGTGGTGSGNTRSSSGGSSTRNTQQAPQAAPAEDPGPSMGQGVGIGIGWDFTGVTPDPFPPNEGEPRKETDPEIDFLKKEIERIKAEQEAQTARQRQDARATISRVLSTYGLGSLSDALWKKYTEEYVDVSNADAIMFSIREEDAYKKRFAANEARRKAGLSELDPASYIQMEKTYKDIMQVANMPPGFYDSTDDFQKFIEGDVSPDELYSRLKDGYRKVADADPEVRRQMERLYGVTDSQLAAYFIDPERARPLMMAADYKRQAAAAQIAARSQEQAGISLSGSLAEDLARRDITNEAAMTGFQTIGQMNELRQQFSGEAALTEEQMVRGQFGIDVAAKQEMERRKSGRVKAFEGGGSFARTQGETSGATRVAIGKAQ